MKTEAEEEKDKHGYVDALLGKLISRKFLVWLTATVLMFISVFTKFTVLKSEDWVIICAIYIGGEAIIDAVAVMKGTTRSSSIASNVVQTIINTSQQNSTIKIQKTKEAERDTSTDRPAKFGGEI